jgi:hypothetical protein
MLTLNTIDEERTFTRQADEYMPLKMEFPPPLTSVDEIYYWRSTNGKYLLEVGLAAATGVLSSITLILIPHDWVLHRELIKDLCKTESSKQGLPVFRLDPWKEQIGTKETGGDPALRIHDEHLPFKLHIAKDGLALLFDDCDPSYRVVNKEISFCFNEANEWCGLISER